MADNVPVFVAPSSTDINAQIDLDSVGIDLPLLKENELHLFDGSGKRISCRYCGEPFSNCDRDEADPVACTSCANLFANNSALNGNSGIMNDSATATTVLY